jgi:hypothetical protein
MKRLAAITLLALAACADSGSDGMGTVDSGYNGSNDGSTTGCSITFFPVNPEASSVAPVRASFNTGSPGVFTYEWAVSFNGADIPYTVESSSGNSIGFIAATAGVYDVTVSVTGGFTSCPYDHQFLTVAAPGANNDVYRLRAVPSPSLGVPPQEQIIQVAGGGDAIRDITLDPGIAASGVVRNGTGGTGVPAYVKFMPVSTPFAFTELFTTSTGTYDTKLVGVPHDVIVIPTSTTLAPKKLSWTASTTSLVVGPGTIVTGTVRNPAGAGLSGAKVQLYADGVPSTLGTTVSDGTFLLRADFPSGVPITVKVTPPATSGLPRLEATAAFTLGSSLQINYASGLQTCDLANTLVRRNAAGQAGAKVYVVGQLAGTAGTVVAGASANAVGTARIAATADGTGRLPATLVPRSSALSAVIEIAANDFAVDAIDTSTCPVLTIDAPAPVVRSGVAKSASNIVLGGIRIEASPVGALALAGVGAVGTTSNASSGAFSITLASGGRYDVRYSDPEARVARREDLDIAPSGIPPDPIMPAAIAIRGKVSLSNSSQALPGTAIQLLCTQCSSTVDATRPIAQTTTTSTSDYRIAVPDPGVM